MPDEPERPVPPPWFEPPKGVLPGLLADRVTLVSNKEVILLVDQFRVHPAGLEFTLSLWLRNADEAMFDMPWELHQRRSSPDDPEFLRFGVQFADGRRWTNLPGPMPDFEAEPEGPVVMPRSGGGGGDHWDMDYWLWPLPPPGDLTFVADWPLHGVAETKATIDGQRIIDCSKTAEVIWPS